MNFCSFSSGSSGNCYYLGDDRNGILIDAGISAGAIRKFLKSNDILLQQILGVLVTHNHTDHTRGLELFARKNNIPVYTTHNIWQSILSKKRNIYGVTVREISLQQQFQIGSFRIEAFPVFHDAPETVGYKICTDSFNVVIATDLGHVCQTSASYFEQANLLVIESNYDEEILRGGSYPQFLKSRVLSDHGHLGNQQTSDYLASIASERLRYVCLAHLSGKNNSPEIAFETLKNTFDIMGVKEELRPQVLVLKRNESTVLNHLI